MKAITILQPFATLIALSEKTFETRSWKTDCRGDLLIHAGKGKQYLCLCDQEPFKRILAENDYDKYNLPRGAIIAKVNLKGCIKVNKEVLDPYSKEMIGAELENQIKIKGNELEFGNYGKGRYAWQLDNVEIFKEPIPVKGQQRLWNFDYEEDR